MGLTRDNENGKAITLFPFIINKRAYQKAPKNPSGGPANSLSGMAFSAANGTNGLDFGLP